MNTKATTAPASELNVTPMLDVLLVLLIIFMAATIRMHHTVDAQVPQLCTGVCEGTGPIVLEILPGPIYRINGAAVGGPELVGRLTSIYRDRPEKILEVAGDRHVPYQEIITAMDMARAAGVRALVVAPVGTLARQ